LTFSNNDSKTRTAREEQSSYNMTIHRNKIILYNCNNGEMYYPGVCLNLFLNANYKTKVKTTSKLKLLNTTKSTTYTDGYPGHVLDKEHNVVG
jgi:uncharacterized OB-fold protein